MTWNRRIYDQILDKLEQLGTLKAPPYRGKLERQAWVTGYKCAIKDVSENFKVAPK